jgi:hypothetical protein
MAEKLSVYVLPRTTGEAVPSNINLALAVDIFGQ